MALLFLLGSCNIYSFCQNTLRYSNAIHYFKIWKSIVKGVSIERVMNSLQNWVSASIIKTHEKQGKTVLFMKIVGIMNKSLNKNIKQNMLWKILPLEQFFVYSARLYSGKCTTSFWFWHGFVKFRNSFSQLTLKHLEHA